MHLADFLGLPVVAALSQPDIRSIERRKQHCASGPFRRMLISKAGTVVPRTAIKGATDDKRPGQRPNRGGEEID
jgi:hypothetical protein